MRSARPHWRLPAVCVAVALVLAGAGCDRRGDDRPRASATTTTAAPSGSGSPAPVGDDVAVEVEAGDHPRGGSARVGVWEPPDPGAPTIVGGGVRALVLPELFVARPDGRWSPGLVLPGSDHTAPDGLSASFRLRDGATWSDGSPITVADLDRTADRRFVASVDAGADGTVSVRFVSKLPGWRRLWSAGSAIAAPAPGVWGGPFSVSSVTPGLETVLARNDRWWGSGGPFLDEIHLVLVPDATTARQLLAAGELDVVMPPAATVRTPQLEAIAGVSVDRVERGGWSVVVTANPDKLGADDRRSLFAAFDRSPFVKTLLAGEATPAQGLAGPEDATWASVAAGEGSGLADKTIDLAGMVEEPMTALLHRSVQKRARTAGGTIELRAAEADRVEGWIAGGEYQAAIVPWLDPLGGCWSCRWSAVGAGGGALARAADTGDAGAVTALEAKLRDDALVLPLWRPATVVAWRDGLHGPRANGYAATGAWNAWEWWCTAP